MTERWMIERLFEKGRKKHPEVTDETELINLMIEDRKHTLKYCKWIIGGIGIGLLLPGIVLFILEIPPTLSWVLLLNGIMLCGWGFFGMEKDETLERLEKMRQKHVPETYEQETKTREALPQRRIVPNNTKKILTKEVIEADKPRLWKEKMIITTAPLVDKMVIAGAADSGGDSYYLHFAMCDGTVKSVYVDDSVYKNSELDEEYYLVLTADKYGRYTNSEAAYSLEQWVLSDKIIPLLYENELVADLVVSGYDRRARKKDKIMPVLIAVLILSIVILFSGIRTYSQYRQDIENIVIVTGQVTAIEEYDDDEGTDYVIRGTYEYNGVEYSNVRLDEVTTAAKCPPLGTEVRIPILPAEPNRPYDGSTGIAGIRWGVFLIGLFVGVLAFRLSAPKLDVPNSKEGTEKRKLTESIVIGNLFSRKKSMFAADFCIALGSSLWVTYWLLPNVISNPWLGAVGVMAGLVLGGYNLIRGKIWMKQKVYSVQKSVCMAVHRVPRGENLFYYAQFENFDSDKVWPCTPDMRVGDCFYLVLDTVKNRQTRYPCEVWSMDRDSFFDKPNGFIWKNLATFATAAVTASTLCLLGCSIAMWL